MRKNILNVILIPFCCNKNHFFVVRLGGQLRRFCTRSVPMLFGALSTVGLITVSGLAELNGSVIALVGLFLTLPDLFYWTVTRLGFVQDRIEIRVANGFLLGIGIIVFGQASIALSIKAIVPLVFFVIMIVADRRIIPMNVIKKSGTTC